MATEHEPIRIWRFDDAPAEFKNLSSHGGDEDWVMVTPAEFGPNPWLPWWRESGFGCCDVQIECLPSGETVFIGAHA